MVCSGLQVCFPVRSTASGSLLYLVIGPRRCVNTFHFCRSSDLGGSWKPSKNTWNLHATKVAPRWPYKASEMSQDGIWIPFWLQNDLQNRQKNCQKSYLAENVIFETPLTRNRCFWHPGPTQNDTKNYSKNHFKRRPSEIGPIWRLGGPTTEVRTQKASKRVPQGFPKAPQNGAKIDKSHVWAPFWGLGTKMTPKWPQNNPKMTPKWHQNFMKIIPNIA